MGSLSRATESRIARSFKAGLSMRSVARLFRLRVSVVEGVVRRWLFR